VNFNKILNFDLKEYEQIKENDRYYFNLIRQNFNMNKMKRFMILSFIKVSFGAFLITSSLMLYGQPKRPAQMPQYLFPDFSSSQVKMKDGRIQNTIMNYNMVSEGMVFVENEKYFDMMNPELVDTVYLQLKKFIPFGNSFLEMLQSKPIALFIQHKGELEDAGVPSGYGGTTKTTASNYIANIDRSKATFNLPIPENYTVKVSKIYWIRKDDKMIDFQNEKQFLKLFPDKSDLIKAFIKKNRLKINKPDNLIQIVNYTSTLM
jgi:hypothetical protein